MNIVKRSCLYLFRKTGKTVSLLLLVLLISVFLLSGFAVLDASTSLAQNIRESVGAAFYIRGQTGVEMNENGESTVIENQVHISQSAIEEILNCGEIKYYNPINYGFAKSDDISFIPGIGHNEESNMGQVTALRYSALAPDFVDGICVLLVGEPITPADTNKILISDQLADANGLAVGDTVTLTHAKLSEENGEYIDEITEKTAFADVTIAGIYTFLGDNVELTPTAGVAANHVYASLDVLNELCESEAGVYTGEVDFFMIDPAEMNDTITEVQQLASVDWSTHFIRTNDFQYGKISEQLSSLGNLMQLLLVCISIVSFTVLTLMLTLRIRGRTHEAGVLLSVGLTKKQIVGQFLMETIAVSAAALILSLFISSALMEVLENMLFADMQLNVTATLEASAALLSDNLLKFDMVKVTLIFICELITISVSNVLASAAVIRLKPKEILSQMD